MFTTFTSDKVKNLETLQAAVDHVNALNNQLTSEPEKLSTVVLAHNLKFTASASTWAFHTPGHVSYTKLFDTTDRVGARRVQLLLEQLEVGARHAETAIAAELDSRLS